MKIQSVLLFYFLHIVTGQQNFVTFNDNYNVAWTLSTDEVEFHVEVRTHGFVGLGINDKGSMGGADIVVAGVFPNGTGYLYDMHATGQTTPIMDASQDYTLKSSSENDTHTILSFSRRLNTCDQNDAEIVDGTLSFIWSFGETDELGYHDTTNRGSKFVTLLSGTRPVPDLSKYKIWEIRNHVTIPSDRTTYWCSIHKTPDHLASKHHFVGFEPILETPEAFKHVHHLDVYKCMLPADSNATATEMFGPFVGKEGVDCFTYMDEPQQFPLQHCLWVQFGWAIGGEITMFPENIGFPLLPNEYYRLEVHFDNPDELSNLTLDSGMKVYYQEEHREIEGGEWLIGSVSNYRLLIPPMSKDFVVSAHCEAACTEHFPEEGISIFAVFLHSHLSGRKIKVRHFRDGKELAWPVYDDNYDFNYQQNRALLEEVKFLRGDRMTLECTYDNTWRNGEPTIGGAATTEEMCLSTFYYYPKMEEFIECTSEMPVQSMHDFFGIEEIVPLQNGQHDPTIKLPLSMANKKFSQVVKEYNWTAESRALFQKKSRYDTHVGQCRPVEPQTIDANYAVFDKAYAPPDTCSERVITTTPAAAASLIPSIFILLFIQITVYL